MSREAASLLAAGTATIEDFPVAMSWAPDGAALAVGGGEGRIYLVRADGGVVKPVGEHAPGVLELAWQPKGAWLASSGQDGAVRLWQPLDMEGEPRVLQRAPRWPVGLAWRADGRQLAFAQGKDVFLFDHEGQPAKQLAGHGAVLSHLAWRGRDELIGAGNGALFVDRADAGSIEQFVLEGTPVTLSLSPDFKVAANGLADGTVNFRYLNSRKRSRMSGYAGKVDQTSWSANSRYLATASTGAASIVVWDFGGKGPEGSEPLQLEGHQDRVESLAFQGNGPLLASAGRDARVMLWRPGPGSRAALDAQLLDGPAGMISWSPDGRRLAVAQPSGKLRFFSLRAA
jgi:WD40 repeat protein